MEQENMISLFYKLSTTFITAINNTLKEYHITFQQYMILDYISCQEKEVVGKDICQYLGISHPTVVGLISRMVSNDFVMVQTSQVDRRQTAIEITKYGKDMLDLTRQSIEGMHEEIKKYMSLNELCELMEILKSLDMRINGGNDNGNT